MAHLDEAGNLVPCGVTYTKPKESVGQFRRILAMGPEARLKMREALGNEKYDKYELLSRLTPWQLARLEARYPRMIDITLELVQEFSKGS